MSPDNPRTIKGVVFVRGAVPEESAVMEFAKGAVGEGNNVVVTHVDAEQSAVDEGLPTKIVPSDSHPPSNN